MSEQVKSVLICWASVVGGLLLAIPFIPLFGEMSIITGLISGFIAGLFIEGKVKKAGWVASGKRAYEERKKDKKADKIKPCKKCGSNYIVPLARSNYYVDGPGAPLDHILQCTVCGHTSKTFDNITEAYADWNGVKRKKKRKKQHKLDWECQKCGPMYDTEDVGL